MTSENPNLGVALRKLRLNEQNVLLEYGGLISLMEEQFGEIGEEGNLFSASFKALKKIDV